MAKLVVLIAGNICAGKTNLVEYLKKEKERFNLFLNAGESLSTITEFTDPVALELFYRDRKAHSEIFEVSCLVGRISRHLKAKYSRDIYFFDRGMIEGAETFCQNSFQEGYLSHDAYARYITLLKRGLDQLDRTQQEKWLERLVVYLRVKDSDIGILTERNQKRQTPGETIKEDYLKRINDLYESFTQNSSLIYSGYGVQPPEVLTIDASIDFNHQTDYLPRTLEKIIDRIKETSAHGKPPL